MDSFGEWAAPLFLGVFCTLFGALKLYGFFKGYEGGPGRSAWERLRHARRGVHKEHCRLPSRVRKPFYLVLWSCFLVLGLCGGLVTVCIVVFA
jgi:hypothetical protein